MKLSLSLSPSLLVAILGLSFTSNAAPLNLLCSEAGKSSATVVEVTTKKNAYGYDLQVLKFKKNFSIRGYGEIIAGAVYDNSGFSFPGINDSDCTDGSGLNVIKEKDAHYLLFSCSIDSVGNDFVRVADLSCK